MGAFSMHDGGCAIASALDLTAAIAQLGERQTEDLKVPGSIPGLSIVIFRCFQCSEVGHALVQVIRIFPGPNLLISSLA